jgi:hypothetical protein
LCPDRPCTFHGAGRSDRSAPGHHDRALRFSATGDGDALQDADLFASVEEGDVDFPGRSAGIGPKMAGLASSFIGGDFGRLRDVGSQKSPDAPETPELTILSDAYCFHQ